MSHEPPEVARGFAETERAAVAGLYWEAFGDKLGRVLNPAFVERALNPEFALVARRGSAVVGVAGFKTEGGALLGGEWPDLTASFGVLGAAWRVPLLSIVERDLAEGVLLMDGICVAPGARGMGVGTLLLNEVKAEARRRGCTSVRLDVIDANRRAAALYVREGFVTGGTRQLGPMRHVFGFRSAREMVFHT